MLRLTPSVDRRRKQALFAGRRQNDEACKAVDDNSTVEHVKKKHSGYLAASTLARKFPLPLANTPSVSLATSSKAALERLTCAIGGYHQLF